MATKKQRPRRGSDQGHRGIEAGEPSKSSPQPNTLDDLTPLRRARAELLLGIIGRHHGVILDSGRFARNDWEGHGLSLGQRDRAVEDLVAAGLVVIGQGKWGGVEVRLAEGES